MTITVEFGERKALRVEGELIEIDEYGHLEVERESFVSGWSNVRRNTSDGKAAEMIRQFLMQHQVPVVNEDEG